MILEIVKFYLSSIFDNQYKGVREYNPGKRPKPEDYSGTPII